MPSERPAAEPLVLAFDTSAAQCAAALVRGRRPLARCVEPMAKGHAERLLPLLQDVVAAGSSTLGDLDALAVCTGPGNFTGIRIGVASARGLALALGIPAIGLTRFEARSYASPQKQIFTALVGGRRYGQTMRAGHPLDTVRPCDDAGRADDDPLDPEVLAAAATERLRAGGADLNQRPTPFYVREADAAPGAEPAPAILADEA